MEHSYSNLTWDTPMNCGIHRVDLMRGVTIVVFLINLTVVSVCTSFHSA